MKKFEVRYFDEDGTRQIITAESASAETLGQTLMDIVDSAHGLDSQCDGTDIWAVDEDGEQTTYMHDIEFEEMEAKTVFALDATEEDKSGEIVGSWKEYTEDPEEAAAWFEAFRERASYSYGVIAYKATGDDIDDLEEIESWEIAKSRNLLDASGSSQVDAASEKTRFLAWIGKAE